MSFLRNIWYVAGHAQEAVETPFSRIFLGEPVLIYRTSDQAVVAMDNRCPHRFAPLDGGKVIDDAIQCPYHGLRFDRTGSCVTMPLGGAPPPRARLKVYPITERHSLLWIWMGDPALADAARIPDFSSLENEAFGWFTGNLYAKANYQLLVDNLLDLSHSEFLHPMLSSDGWSGRNEQSITQEGNTVRVHNVAHNDNILPIMRMMRPDLPALGTTVQQERWEAPGLIQLSVEFYGDGKELVIPSGHFLTPETESATHYFVRGGQNVAPQNAEMTAGARAGVLHIFQHEDIPMIEAQQRYVGNDVEFLAREPAILKSDGGGVRARRLLARMIRDEAKQPGYAAAVAE